MFGNSFRSCSRIWSAHLPLKSNVARNSSPSTTYYWQVGAIAADDVGGWGVYGPTPPWSIVIGVGQPKIRIVPSVLNFQ